MRTIGDRRSVVALGAAALAVASLVPRRGAAQTAGAAEQRLVQAAASGQLTALREALAAGASPDAVDADGRTALMRAATGGHEALARALVAAGAVAQTRDREGRSAADHARAAGHGDLAAWLEIQKP